MTRNPVLRERVSLCDRRKGSKTMSELLAEPRAMKRLDKIQRNWEEFCHEEPMNPKEFNIITFISMPDNQTPNTDGYKPKELTNLRNTCYLNPVIHCLTCCRSFTP